MNAGRMSARRVLGWTVTRAAHEAASSRTTVDDYLWKGPGSRVGGRTALVCGQTGRSIGYDRLKDLTDRVSGWLTDNLARDRGLALILPNCLEFAVAGLAAFRSGVPLCPIDPAFKNAELVRVLRSARPGCVLAHSLKIPDVLEAKRQLEAEEKIEYPLILVSVDDQLKFNGVLHLDEIAEATPRGRAGAPRPTPDDTALVVLGAGGPLRISHSNLVANCRQLEAPELSALRGEPQSGLAALLPPFRGYGLTGVLVAGLRVGARVVTFPNLGQVDFPGQLKDRGVTAVYTDPATLCRLVGSAAAGDELAGVESVTVGGGAVPLTDLTRLMEILPSGAEVSREYGLPEGPVLFHQPRGTNKLSSVGRPLPRTWAAIVDPATGEELRDRTEGEIVAKGPQVPLDCEEHARGDGWVATGDLGYRDKDGFFYVTGRLRDTVRLEGLEVSPAEVEQQLTAHPEVADCGLFWRPQGPEPEAAVAVVVARTPSNPPSPKELADFLAARLAPYKRISSVVFAEHIPRFPDGRIDRKRLAQENGVRTRVEFVAPTYL